VAGDDLRADTHEAPLTVRGLVVTQPLADAVVVTGATLQVRWTGLGAGPSVDLSYSVDGGTNYSMIATNVPNADGTNVYAWVVPELVTTQAMVMVTSPSDALVAGGSGMFSISDAGGAASLQGDGIPDSWRITYGLDPENQDGLSGADDDFDGDGMDNLGISAYGMAAGDESATAAGGDPASDRFALRWQTVAGKRYTIMGADAVDGEWGIVSDVLTAEGTELIWVDPRTNAVQRFYRVVLVTD